MSRTMIDALKEILLRAQATSQEEIKQALEQQGYEINQSKISRLLRKLGAVKTSNERKQVVYSLPREPAPFTSKNMLSELIMSISHNETMIIIHTNPGSASLIARLLDHHLNELNILGTVAGDDTVFIAPTSVKRMTDTLQILKQFLAVGL